MEISRGGASSTAQKVQGSAEGARASVRDVQQDEVPQLQESIRQVSQSDSSPDLVTASGPQPTTSLDARVVLTDQSEVPMWLQTAVVDRTGKGSQSIDDAVFVLELRDKRNMNSLLHAQLDVSMIQTIERLGPPISPHDQAAHASFVITALPEADLGGSVVDSEEELWNVCHTGAGGMITLYAVAGPSPWVRREATRFFDELRIMTHFLMRDPP